MAVVTQIDSSGNDIIFTFSNTVTVTLTAPFVLDQYGIIQTKGNIINNYYIIKGRQERKIRFGNSVTLINGIAFAGDFEQLGDEITQIIIDINGGSGGPVDTDGVTNVSTVPGATASDALESLEALINALNTDDIANNSTVTGIDLTDALDQLQTLINNLQTSVSNLDSSDISNVSGVLGIDVTAALNTLESLINALNSDDIANNSTVPGADVTDALDDLQSQINTPAPPSSFPSSFTDAQTMIADSITGDQNNYLPTQAGKNFEDVELIYITPTNNLNIDGLQAPVPPRRAIKILVNNSTNRRFTLRNNRASSAAANRFLIGGNERIEDSQSAFLVYNTVASRWNLISKHN